MAIALQIQFQGGIALVRNVFSPQPHAVSHSLLLGGQHLQAGICIISCPSDPSPIYSQLTASVLLSGLASLTRSLV